MSHAARRHPGEQPGPRALLPFQHHPARRDGDRRHARAHLRRQGARRPRGDGDGRAQPPRLDLRRPGDALARRTRPRRARPHRRPDLRERGGGRGGGRGDDPRRRAARRGASLPGGRGCRKHAVPVQPLRPAGTQGGGSRPEVRAAGREGARAGDAAPGRAADVALRSRRPDGDGQHRRGAGPPLRHHAGGGGSLRAPLADEREGGA